MTLDLARRAVLIDMAYEIGGAGLSHFHEMLSAIRAGNWIRAGIELKQSLLYGQVPKREDENIDLLVNGIWPSGIATAEGLVQHHEGCIFTAKPDAKGKWSIGWGHDIPAPAGRPVTCTQEQADLQLILDLSVAEARAIETLGKEFW